MIDPEDELLSREIQRVASQIKRGRGGRNFMRLGKVVAINGGSPPTVQVLSNGVTYPAVTVLGSAATAAVDDSIWIIDSGRGRWLGVGTYRPLLPTTGGRMSGPLRIDVTNDLSPTSTLHGFQVGLDNGLNIGIDNNEIMARDGAGNPAQLGLNYDGGIVATGDGGIVSTGPIKGAWETGSGAGHLTMAANWTLTTFFYAKMGNLLQFRLIAVRANTTIGWGTTGDIANTLVATLGAPLRGNYSLALGCVGGVNGRLVTGTFNPNDGEIYVTAIGGTTALGIGESITLGGMFYMGT